LFSGHTILHELNHLHSLGLEAGLDPDLKTQECGTVDAQDGCEIDGARDCLLKFKSDKTLDSPNYNAESHAAAATGKA
jgi:hypothetical protein